MIRNTIKRRVLAAALSLALSVSPILAAETEEPTEEFQDMSNHWAREYVSAVVKHGLFAGTGEHEFSPDIEMTRGMFMTVLGKFCERRGTVIEDIPDGEETPFIDVTPDAYYAKYAAWAAREGLAAGVGDGQFAPNQSVTREQMCTLMIHVMQWSGVEIPEPSELSFLDRDDISEYAVEAVARSAAVGLIVGVPVDGGLVFQPQAVTTRAAAATVFVHLSQAYGVDLMQTQPNENPDNPDNNNTDDGQSNSNSGSSGDSSSGGGSGGSGGGGGSSGGGGTGGGGSGGSGGGGGSGGSGGGGNTGGGSQTNEKITEEVAASYLQIMVDNFKDLTYLSFTDQIVQDTMTAAMDCVADVLAKHAEGSPLTKEFVRTNYSSQIESVRAQYRSMTEDQRNQTMRVALRLATTRQLSDLSNYFDVSI